MFFVAQQKIGTTLGAQKEFSACSRRGIIFANDPGGSGRSVWHYLWPIDMVEPSIRARFTVPPQPTQQPDEDALADGHDDVVHNLRPVGPTHVIWSQEVGPGEVIGDPLINASTGRTDWLAEARQLWSRHVEGALPGQ